jgi:O-6-methylguanine DNA methyltransferase
MNFSQKVYKIVSQIPAGRVMTYKEVAEKSGSPRAHRAVGTLMKNNPDKKTIPCHRVVCSDGSLGGYAFGGAVTKKKILMKEGIEFKGDRVIL